MPRKPNYDRNDLINRARDLFWKRGWAGTSLKDLEGELQMKPGSFYAAFGSKDALFELALESLLKAASERDPARAVYQLNAMISNYATKENAHQVASTG